MAYRANGFSARRETRLPTALMGYDVVQLHDQQQWQLGLKSMTTVYDGQRYNFSNARQRAIFLAAPHHYVPALGGQCMVTYVESGRRVAGDPKYGLLYQGRIYLFSSSSCWQEFQDRPAVYRDADLAGGGNCPVTWYEEKRRIPGIPATLLIHDGFRYLFANSAARARFLESPDRYGQAKSPLSAGLESHQGQRLRAGKSPTVAAVPEKEMAADSMLSFSTPQSEHARPGLLANVRGRQELVQNSANQQSPAPMSDSLLRDESESLTKKPALGGFCPVSIHGDDKELGLWVEGKEAFQATCDGKLYLFAGGREKSQFLAAPERYIPALGGECVVCSRDLGKEVHGSIFHAAIYRDRLFLFADAEQKVAFKQDPTSYDQVDLALAGKCVVTLLEDGKRVDGDANAMAWYHNRRYLFASSEYRQKFLAAPERYVDH